MKNAVESRVFVEYQTVKKLTEESLEITGSVKLWMYLNGYGAL